MPLWDTAGKSRKDARLQSFYNAVGFVEICRNPTEQQNNKQNSFVFYCFKGNIIYSFTVALKSKMLMAKTSQKSQRLTTT